MRWLVWLSGSSAIRGTMYLCTSCTCAAHGEERSGGGIHAQEGVMKSSANLLIGIGVTVALLSLSATDATSAQRAAGIKSDRAAKAESKQLTMRRGAPSTSSIPEPQARGTTQAPARPAPLALSAVSGTGFLRATADSSCWVMTDNDRGFGYQTACPQPDFASAPRRSTAFAQARRPLQLSPKGRVR
jgi:hypothetical protein